MRRYEGNPSGEGEEIEDFFWVQETCYHSYSLGKET